MANEILRKTARIVRCQLGAEIENILVVRIVVGFFFTGVKLSTGHAGACSTPAPEIRRADDELISLSPRQFAEEQVGHSANSMIERVAELKGIRRAVGIATLNALAELTAERRDPKFEMMEGLDAFEAAEIKQNERVVVVGAFVPFLQKLRQMGIRHWVLEKNPSMLKPDDMPHFCDAADAATIVPAADVLIITGSTLVNDTLGNLIALASHDARIVVVGPTVNMIPDAFFERGCDVVGGIRITDPDRFLGTVLSGGRGHHFFGSSATKIAFRRL